MEEDVLLRIERKLDFLLNRLNVTIKTQDVQKSLLEIWYEDEREKDVTAEVKR